MKAPKVTNTIPPLTDLRKICRDSDKSICQVRIEMEAHTNQDWLILGCVNLRQTSDRRPGEFFLEAQFAFGVTNIEHDPPYAIRHPVVGIH